MADDIDPLEMHNRAGDALMAGDTDAGLELSLGAAAGGVTSSMNNAGVLLMQDGRLEEAEHWLRAATDPDYREHAGIPPDPAGYIVARTGDKLRSPTMLAQLSLGRLLQRKGNSREARTWFETAASTRQPDALWELANFEHTCGNAIEALEWCRRAAEAGNDAAQNTMGIEMAQAGDLTAARHWWRLAAANGNSDAAGNLTIHEYD